MSYCRFSGETHLQGASDLYLYMGDEGIVCCGCALDGHYYADEGPALVAHIQRHVEAGHVVRDYIQGCTAEEWDQEFQEFPPTTEKEDK